MLDKVYEGKTNNKNRTIDKWEGEKRGKGNGGRGERLGIQGSEER